MNWSRLRGVGNDSNKNSLYNRSHENCLLLFQKLEHVNHAPTLGKNVGKNAPPIGRDYFWHSYLMVNDEFEFLIGRVWPFCCVLWRRVSSLVVVVARYGWHGSDLSCTNQLHVPLIFSLFSQVVPFPEKMWLFSANMLSKVRLHSNLSATPHRKWNKECVPKKKKKLWRWSSSIDLALSLLSWHSPATIDTVVEVASNYSQNRLVYPTNWHNVN